MTATQTGFTAFDYKGRDGLTLRGRNYGSADSSVLPVVCLPGLTRTARDFHELATYLSAHGRRVVAFDYRGRGASDRDPTGLSYNPMVELHDVLDGMANRGIARAAIIGTSRGGIVAMLMGAVRPAAIAGVVLNDIGSVIDTAGLLRIKSYVGPSEPPADWADAVRRLKAVKGAFFPAFDETDWMEQTRLTFDEVDGAPVSDYDPALAKGMETLTAESPPVDLTQAFATLAKVPVLLLRGSLSDLLSAETVLAMHAAHPRLEAIEVAGEGHPPMLRGPLVSEIAAFIDRLV